MLTGLLLALHTSLDFGGGVLWGVGGITLLDMVRYRNEPNSP
jgi:hypothetical protein